MATTPNRGYQLPAPGSKLKDDVLRLIAALVAIDGDVAGLLTGLAGKSDLGHGHAMAEITGLIAALGSKLDVGYHDALANLTDVDVAGVANGMALLRQASKWIPVALQINNIAGLETALNGKATPADITAAINALVAAAPGTLDTLNELAAALGNDPNFATTITAALAGKQPLDSDLTAIAALTTTAFGRALLTLSDAPAIRSYIGAGVLSGFRNKIINGDFAHWQRAPAGTANTGASNGFPGPDRWFFRGSDSTGGSIFLARTAGSPFLGTAYLRIVRAGATSDQYHTQRIEGLRQFSGKKVTVTFLTEHDANELMQVRLFGSYGTGGSPSAPEQLASSGQFTAQSGPRKHTFVFDLPSLDSKTFGANGDDNLALQIEYYGRNNTTLRIGRISLVEGDATAEADPFSPRHIQQELALCRYYYRTGKFFWRGPATAASRIEVTIPMEPMRASPTPVVSNVLAVGAYNGAAPTLSALDRQTLRTSTSVLVASTADGTLSFDWSADAEL